MIWTGAAGRLDNAVYDFALKLQQHQPRPDIVIVAIDPKSLEQVGQWPWPRRAEANLIADIAMGKPKALACYMIFVLKSTRSEDLAIHKAMLMTRTFVPLLSKQGSDRHSKPLPLIPEVASAVAGMSPTDVTPDQDGIVRRVSLFGDYGPDNHARLELQMARLGGVDPQRFRRGGGALLIPFVGPPGAFKTFSATEVLAGRVSRDEFRGKFVMIGATAPDLLDVNPTPMSAANNMAGVEVNANILEGILNDRWIVPVSPGLTTVIWLSLFVVLLVGLIRLKPAHTLWLAAALSLLPLAGAVAGVVYFGVWLPPVAYLLTVALVIPFWGWRRLNATSAYFADELLALEKSIGEGALAPAPEQASLGGDVVLRQITLLEETRRRISDLRRFVSDILENFPDPVLVVDSTSHIITGNNAALDFAARADVSVVGKAPIVPVLERLLGPEKDVKDIWPPRLVDEAGASRSPVTVIDQFGPEQTPRCYELRFTETRDAEDVFSGWIVHLADVTSLTSAMDQREEALVLISHDMRTPQASILAAIDQAKGQPAPPEMLKRIGDSARQTLRLADDFVQLARAESAVYKTDAIDLIHVIQDATEALWTLATGAGVDIDFLQPDDVEYVVEADRALLTRALINLFDNAVKYSPRGGKVTCRLSPTRLMDRPAVACEIADDGEGMPDDVRKGLFRRYAPTGRAKGDMPSAGLGLALVQAVVHRHHGVIDCRSAPGQRTVFTLVFPLAEDEGMTAD